MKSRLLFSTFAWLSLLITDPAVGQTFSAFREVGPRASNLNFIFLAEGYTASQQSKFGEDAEEKIEEILEDDSWERFDGRINAFGIFVASAESGADDPTLGITRDTYFNSSFGVFGIQRLLGIPPFTPGNTNHEDGVGKVNTLLAQFAPDYDVVILLVNSNTYGGAGGFPTITSLNEESNEVVLHELGHSFALLTDEYVDAAAAPSYPPAEYSNATQITDPMLIPWRRFIAPDTPIPTTSASSENVVGLFQGSHYRAEGFYRPTFNSKMRSLNRPWGPVNLRQFAARVHAYDLDGAASVPVITAQPAPAIVAEGQSHVVSVDTAGAGVTTFQWCFNGRYVPGATSDSYTIPSLNLDRSGLYAVEVTNARGSIESEAVWIGIAGSQPVPQFTVQPLSQNVTAGDGLTLQVTVSGVGPFNYQWRRNGLDVAGANAAELRLPSAQRFHAGDYTVIVSNASGSVESAVATVGVDEAAPSVARIKNLSTRALCLTVDQRLIPGFVVAGTVDKRLLIRAVGPELANFGVAGALEDPRMVLRTARAGEVPTDVASNDDWGSNANALEIASTAAALGAFPLTTGGKDAALLIDLAPGPYTVVASGAADGTGVSIVELYDASGGSGDARLVNISNRGFVGTAADIMIPGFVVSEEGSRTVLLRAIGPALADFGVSGVLEDPKLTVFRRVSGTASDEVILTNNDWGENGEGDDIIIFAQQVGAFPLPPASKDAAFVVTLPPGVYTVHAAGADGGTGVALVELYVIE